MKKNETYFQQSNGQLALFQPDFIRDADCTKDTPIIYGKPDTPIYGTGKRIRPRVPGRRDSKYMEKILLEELLPLESYDLIILLISGGKDSIACYYELLELGVPKQKIEFWHHDIDGGHPERKMDWRCTSSYIRAFSEAEQVPLRVSWRKNGFFGELYRIGASEPIEWQEPDTQEIMQCALSKKYKECLELKKKSAEDMEKQLEQFGYRMKFPRKTGDLSKRWCSAYLKIMVADTVLRNLDSLERLEKLGGKRLKFPAKGATHDLCYAFLFGKEKIMKFAERIFERATVKGVADYLLYGMVPDKDDRSYETRLDDADLIFEKVAKQYGEDGASILLSAADELVNENASIYMELGLQAGILLLADLFQNICRGSNQTVSSTDSNAHKIHKEQNADTVFDIDSDTVSAKTADTGKKPEIRHTVLQQFIRNWIQLWKIRCGKTGNIRNLRRMRRQRQTG